MATIRQKLGRKIRELRLKNGLTQEKLAEIAKIDYTYLNLIENGRRNPSVKILAKLARALDVSLNELFPSKKK